MHLIDHETVENAYLFVFSTLFFVSHKNSFFQSDTIPSQSLLVTKAGDTSWPANILPNNGLLIIIILIFIKADHQMLMLMLIIDKNRKERARASESKVRIDHIKKVLFIYLGTLSRSKAEVYIYSSFWWCFLITKRSQAKVFFLKKNIIQNNTFLKNKIQTKETKWLASLWKNMFHSPTSVQFVRVA